MLCNLLPKMVSDEFDQIIMNFIQTKERARSWSLAWVDFLIQMYIYWLTLAGLYVRCYHLNNRQ